MQDYQHRSREYGSPYDDVLSNGRRSYNFSNMQKSVQLSQTDKRIEEIKRKYDTPNRKDRISQLSAKKYDLNNKENQNYGTADFKTKIPITVTQTQGSQAGMKESKAISNSRQSFFNNPSSTSKSYFGNGLGRQRDSYDSKLASNKLYTNENEEQFFKRVKEMKQSLLYGDNSNKQSEMKSSTFYPNRQSRARSGFYDSNQTIERDRIDNIDKINQKIKGILECLNENQKTRIPSRNDLNKRSKVDILGNNDQEINVRDIARTPVKNVVSSSIMGRQSFGNHRHERSEILDKIEINRQFKDENKKMQPKKTQDDDRWQKLSSKIEKYELQNKLRLQKAYDFSKEAQKQPQASKQNIVVDNIRKERYGFQQQNDFKRSTELIRRDNRSMDLRDIRSRSFLNPQTSIKETRDRSLYARDLTGQKNYDLKSGKKLDDEIDRIQKKIQQFEEQKKRLNINFKPFNYSNSKSSSNLFMNNHRNEVNKSDYSERKISDFNRLNANNESVLNCKSKQSLKQQFDRLQNQETFREKKEYRDMQILHDGSFNRLDSKIQIKIEKSNPSSVRTSKFISHGSSRVSNDKQEQEESFRLDRDTKQESQQESKSYERSYNYFADENLKKQTDQGIEERRKKLMNYQDHDCQNGELKKLVRSLCDQVQLDEEFRNAKIWYEYSNDPRKQDQIRKLLPNKTLQQIRDIFKVRESENNPFFTTQGYESSYTTLIDLFKKSEVHWNETLCRKYSRDSLENQGFTAKDIDLEKKGHINLGDLVRFLNLESGTFYRNRDLSLVFIRIAKQHNSQSHTEVSFSQMIETFCR